MASSHTQLFTLNDKIPHSNSYYHQRIILVLIGVSLLSVAPIGYHLVVLNVPIQVIQDAINTTAVRAFNWYLTQSELSLIWAIVVAVQSVGALIGCALAPFIVSYFGTKVTISIVSSTVLALTSLVFTISNSNYSAFFLILGRFLSGLYIGITCVAVPFMVQELAPKNIRGALSCTVHIGVCLGSTLASILSLQFLLGSERLWGILLALPAVTAFIQLFGSWFVPDTPNHLLLCGQESQAVHSLKFYYCMDSLNNVEAIDEYRQLVTQFPNQISLRQAFFNPSIRKAIFIGVVVSASQIFCGSVATAAYSTSMFKAVSFFDIFIPYLPAFGSLLSAVLTLPAVSMVESFGRRSLFLVTLGICTLCDWMFVLFALLSQDGVIWSLMFAFTFVLFGFGYNLGVGPAAYFMPGELVPPEAASVALSVAVAVNWLSIFATTFLYYPLNTMIGGWSYLLFGVPSLAFLAFLYESLPETKDLCIGSVQAIRCTTPPSDYGTFIVL